VKYILMMNTMKANAGPFPGWSKQDIQGMIQFMIRFDQELRQSGELVSAEGLSFPDQARIVRAGKSGEPIVETAFPEGKEFLAGFWIVDVANPERANEIAARASAAPGAGGEPMNMPIEVRPVPSGPPPEFV